MPRPSIDYMNRARDLHRARGTSGGKGNSRQLSKTELAWHEDSRNPFKEIAASMRYATVDAIEQYRFDIYGDDWSSLCPF